jgi:hypothetical protein
MPAPTAERAEGQELKMAGRPQARILTNFIVVLAVLECLGWAFAFAFASGFLTIYVALTVAPNELFLNPEFRSIVVSSVLLLNIAGTMAFLFRGGGYGVPLLAAVQVVNIGATLGHSLHNYVQLLLELRLSAIPAFTLLLLLVLQVAVRRPLRASSTLK